MANSEEYQLNQEKNKRGIIIVFAVMIIVISGIVLLGFYLDGK